MHVPGTTVDTKVWRTALTALLVVILWASLAVAQDSPTDVQTPTSGAAPAARAGKKHPQAPAKPKPGEVIPLDQAGPAEPSLTPVDTTPSLPAAGKTSTAASKRRDKNSAASDSDAPIVQVRTQSKGGAFTLGALLPLTGHLAAQGQSSKAALDLAVADINATLAGIGSAERIALKVEDTASTPQKCLDALKSLAGSGIKLVVGPYSDNEADSVLDFANKNGIMLLSQGSAGPYLAKSGDNLFRFSPADPYQAEALAVLASQEGCTTLITIWEGDMYGDELVTHVKGQFANLGGQVIAGTRFRPDETSFTKYVADLKAQIDKQVKDKKHLGILVAAHGEQTSRILKEAVKIGGLGDVKWYGGDDSALRGSITQDPEVAKFAAGVRLAFARFGETGTLQYSALEKRLEEKINAFVDTQSLVAYDIAWLAMYVAQLGSMDPSALKKAIPAVAERFYGATGWLALNDYGDRREGYNFDFWTVRQMEGKYFWVKTARYQNDPGNVKQLIMNGSDDKDAK